MAILFGYMEGLLGKREHLGTFLGSHAPLEDGQHLSQRLSKEADNDISTSRIRSTNVQANNPALHKAETRAIDKIC